MKTQLELSKIIIALANVNVVTCGSCGDVLLHETNDEEITCPYCGFESEPCDFPDYFYEPTFKYENKQ